MPKAYRNSYRIKALLAHECARLIAEEGVKDLRTAKRKAALRLAVTDKACFPDNTEIEQALLNYQRLFHGDRHENQLRTLRETALKAMDFLEIFRPRLVGAVLSGTADHHSDVQLHLFAETPKDVLIFLMEQNVPLETSERRFRLNSGDSISRPVFRFEAGDTSIDLTVFELLDEREAPRSPIDGQPLRRAGRSELTSLLA
jgi:hypothetical protein